MLEFHKGIFIFSAHVSLYFFALPLLSVPHLSLYLPVFMAG